MSRKADINLSMGVDISALEKGWHAALKASYGDGKKLENQTKEQVATLQAQMAKLGKAKTLKSANRQMENLLGTMSQFGMEGSAAFGEVLKHAGALKDKEKDIVELIDMHSTALPWKAMSKAVKGAGQAVQLGTSAMALFGDESEETQKMLLKVQAAMSFAQGLDSIETLQDSFKALGIVIKANPIFFASTAIALVATAAYKLSQALDTNYQAQKRLNEITEKATDNIQNEVVEMDNLIRVAKNENASRELRQKAVDKLQKTYPSYLKNINLENINSQETAAAIKSVTVALLNKAKATAVQEELVEALKEERALYKELNNKKPTGLIKAFGRLFTGDSFYVEDAAYNASMAVIKLKNELSKLTIMNGIDFDVKEPTKDNSVNKDAFTKRIEVLQNAQSKERALIKEQLINNEISEYKAKQALSEIDMVFSNKRLSIHKKYGRDVIQQTEKNLDDQIAFVKAWAYNMDGLPPVTVPVKLDTDPIMVELKTPLKNVIDDGIKINDEFNQILQQSSAQLTSSLAKNMYNAMATNQDVGDAMSATVMTGLGDFLENMGQTMIAAATAKLAFDTAMVQFGGAGGALAAGFGLTLAGTALKSAMSKSMTPVPLAEGGVLRGTTFGMLAEYPTANIDPEVAIRSSYLKRMIGEAVNGGGVGGNVIFRIEGRDLVGVLNRGQNDINRA